MRLLMVDEDGGVVQEYGGVTAQADGIDLEAGVIKVVIPRRDGRGCRGAAGRQGTR